MHRMNLESMPDEIFLEIFDYISSYDLIYSFYNLNQRFNSIIHGIHLYLDLSYVQQKKFLFTCHYILPNFCQQIYSIKLSNKQTIDGIQYFIEQSKYCQQEQVKTLILTEPTIEQLIKLIRYFPFLKTLIIKTTDYLVVPIELISRSLRICRISNCQIDFLSSNISEKIYFIEELNLKISDINSLFILLNSMIYLKHLTCHISKKSSIKINSKPNFQKSLKFLTYLKLNVFSISFKCVESLLNICPNLTSLIYTYTTGLESSYDNEHIDTERWNNLFINKLNRLKIFDLHISLNIDPQRDLMLITNKFQDLIFFRTNNIRIIYEITSYKHIICTIPFTKLHLNNYIKKPSVRNIHDAYSRIRHFDLILNQTILYQQQHTIRCPLVHSFYLGLYENITPIEHQSRLLLNQSISFVYLKHFELYGTCITDGFAVQLLTKMTNLDSLTLPLNHLISCQINDTIRQNMKRIKKLQLSLTESISIDCVKNILIPIFPNLHSMSFAIDNKIHSFDKILLTMIGQNNNNYYLKYLMFLELFALDQDWDHSMLIQLKKFIRYKNNYRFLYIWL
ncbi:unnamed protein product [Rotaria sp. Silwood1]|nr:unnamed protein product [Rotaria sp. Silwood1]CAF3324621.1 unnamed protein product [Rotaria sp. Silwood1]CAF3341425.1 unnamed protein product [Rotaria sp. Silwood1]CAF3349866.1 unnamed protein product [Rotaria sp. Silwood1]CAF4520340.1 unnamed protein product [Rotaria sp. Silwood1]